MTTYTPAQAARSAVSVAAAASPGATLTTPPVGLTCWIAEGLRIAAESGNLTVCDHADRGPILAGWWAAPGVLRITCPPCMAAWVESEVKGTAADHSCDRCGTLVGPRESWGARGAFTLHTTIWTLGLCCDCATLLGLNGGAK